MKKRCVSIAIGCLILCGVASVALGLYFTGDYAACYPSCTNGSVPMMVGGFFLAVIAALVGVLWAGALEYEESLKKAEELRKEVDEHDQAVCTDMDCRLCMILREQQHVAAMRIKIQELRHLEKEAWLGDKEEDIQDLKKGIQKRADNRYIMSQLSELGVISDEDYRRG